MRKMFRGTPLNPLSARKMTSLGLRLSEATQLHNDAWVVALLGPLFGVQDRKNVKFSWAIHRSSDT